MTKNPYINAGAAAAYIAGLTAFMSLFAAPDTPDSLLAPVLALSLFTLSAAVMGYLFVYQPLLLILDGKRQEGARLFLHTIGFFALVIVVLAALEYAIR